ncbi:hypothetical protein NE237_026090 [Protea cynaroides]|uniref:Uncharacterized protein n=1 Tax=Protea cynaroides TaxID=273540 RepID=A0A9Q0H4C5_9MAGN|nr:hypothetical protein NE237_026090 [Protea cynaroides]
MEELSGEGNLQAIARARNGLFALITKDKEMIACPKLWGWFDAPKYLEYFSTNNKEALKTHSSELGIDLAFIHSILTCRTAKEGLNNRFRGSSSLLMNVFLGSV